MLKRAKVISGGNIIILGNLHGSAVAGKDLQKNALYWLLPWNRFI